MMWYEIKDNFVFLNIKVLPNSSKNVLGELYNDQLKVKIKAPAVEGAANKELVKFFSKKFKLSKSDIEFVSGMTNKQKKIKLPINDRVLKLIKEKSNG